MLALPKWDGPYSSTSFSLAKEFSSRTRTFYIDNPVTFKDLFLLGNSQIRKRIKYKLMFKNSEKLTDNLIIIYPSFVIPINFLKKGWLYKVLFNFNSYLAFSSIKRVLRKYNCKDYIYINSFNPFYSHSAILYPKLFVYHTVDEIRLSPYIKKHGGWLEELMFAEADFALTTSMKLKTYNDKFSDNVHYLPNAADFDLFKLRPKQIPIELSGLKNEIIIYTGHLDWRSDLEMLIGIAKYQINRLLVFVGPVSLNHKEVDRLRFYQNVIFVGPQPLNKLSSFLYNSHCAIIPFKRNELTESIYPLKVNEYLATGIPVVATSFSEDIKTFSGVISLADSIEEFNKCIDTEIKLNNEMKIEKRKKCAESNTWKERGNQFWGLVEDYLE